MVRSSQARGIPCEPLAISDFSYALVADGPETRIGLATFSYSPTPGDGLSGPVQIQITQDGVCKRELMRSTFSEGDIKAGKVAARIYCVSPNVDEPVEFRLLDNYLDVRWTKKLKMTCSRVEPELFCGCEFCPEPADQ